MDKKMKPYIMYDGKAFVWANPESIEESALKQIEAIALHPRLFEHVAIMPDVHAGVGATIGSVIPIKNAVIPSAVGVDIGCGMCAVKTGIPIEELSSTEQKKEIYEKILKVIPVGFNHRTDTQLKTIMDMGIITDDLEKEINYWQTSSIWNSKPIINQIGTLGGGNHFIELQVDEDGFIWVMVHSGSRNIGNKIATSFIKWAKEGNEKKQMGAPVDLEFFEYDSILGSYYLDAVGFATEFAFKNREAIILQILDILTKRFGNLYNEPMINIHHNYVNIENHFGETVYVHRKGATRVTSHITGIIPGSMGTSSYIVMGADNKESFNSCSHGAGRKMSRTAARGKMRHGKLKTRGVLRLDDFQSDMEGIYSGVVDSNHLDEAPRAYKDIDTVMENQSDLVKIYYKLRPILNIKG